VEEEEYGEEEWHERRMVCKKNSMKKKNGTKEE
jgi:hypothetical protein